jgi:stage II sporulation protein D
MATSQTAGQVIIDGSGKMISAAFHSNSGGQTMNSEDVWTLPTPYLKSVVDTFSLNGRNAKWEKRMPAAEWLNFLKNTYNYPVNDSIMKQQALNFKQEKRLVYFPGDIHLKDIRRDLKLKSTFFSVSHVGNEVVLEGRGFGHGVGMSQEGAIRMIQLGYSYEDVINFYYQNVKIVSFDKLDYFFINFNF